MLSLPYLFVRDTERKVARMKVVFELLVNSSKKPIQLSGELMPFQLDDIKIEWITTVENHLNAVIFTVSDAKIQVDEKDQSLKAAPELNEKVFSVAAYLANRMYIKTGLEILDPSLILLNSPAIVPETSEEKKMYAHYKKEGFIAIRSSANIVSNNFLVDANFVQYFKFFKAYASYADGLRVISPFLRYVQFYKVIEHFFPEEDFKIFLDKVVNFAYPLDKRYNKNQIRIFREIRNRCVHQNAHLGHLSPSDLALFAK